VLPSNWSEKYGDWDLLSRRQGNIANLSSIAELAEVAQEASRLGLHSSLALNVHYTAEQIPHLLALACEWELAGGNSVTASDLGLLIALQKEATHLRRHVSILANLTNSKAIQFYLRLGIKRVVLPRELTLSEMGALIAHEPNVEYEAMALSEKCRFIDGLCGFYHGTIYPKRMASAFVYEYHGPAKTPTVFAHDLCYAGHGCRVPFMEEDGTPIAQLPRDDVNQPACAACSLTHLRRIGLRYLKIGGRGMPTKLKKRAVSFLRDAVRMTDNENIVGNMRRLYETAFNHPCRNSTCYYETALERSGD
jgi:collagenase-like PrtC family protease